MSTKLSDQAHAVLVIIALRSTATAYQIERSLDQLAGEFWSAPHTQVYRECRRLAEAGLLREEQERTGRRRRVFKLTKRGRDTIVRWIRTPTDRSIEIRDISHLKLLAAELSTPEDIRRLAEAQMAAYRRRLRVLDDLEARYGARPELTLRLTSIGMGRAVYRAALSFWSGIAERAPKRRGS